MRHTRSVFSILLLTLLCGCSAAEILDTTHATSVIAAPAAVAYAINPVAGSLVLVTAAAAELFIPDGTEEHIREARRDILSKLEDPNSTEPLPARLQNLKDELEQGETAFTAFREWLSDILFWAAIIICASVAFQLWHFWFGSRKSNSIEKKNSG